MADTKHITRDPTPLSTALEEAVAAKQAREAESRCVLGHTFLPMVAHDWEALAGAEPGSRVCYLDDLTLVLSPDGTEVAVVDADGRQTTWRLAR